LDRLDLIDYGRLLFGRDVRDHAARPGRSELLIVGAEFALDFLAGGRSSGEPSPAPLGSMTPGEDVTEEIRQADLLVRRGPRCLTKIVLFPVRFLFTAEAGQVGTNELAVEHHLATRHAPAADLVAAALAWRIAAPGDNAVELVRRDLVPLYLHYIDDHIARLTGAGRGDLTVAFEGWRDRIRA
jgi:hypothetical protein